jgi:lipoprotein-anchoring transpeptidase ErfK/SrfK
VIVSGHSVLSMNGRLWRVAVVTAAGTIGTASYAQAALYYWSDSDGGYSRPGPPVQPPRQGPRHHQAKKTAAPEKEGAKPQGPLIISISIDKQKLRVYDANGFYAETPISTGMKGHPTPMGVFSVIQKHKLHHSNIYSNAPMPFMQRITWSGVAMHAGVLPGYPASHGCIRMPMAFAVKMWNWTKMGARVVVTPGEMTPSSISHPLLVAQKTQPAAAADQPQGDTPPAAKADKASSADVTAQPVIAEAKLELRPTVGHHEGAKPDVSEQPATPSRQQTRTADASSALPATSAPVTMSDAAPTTGNAASRKQIKADPKPEEAAPADTTSVEAKSVETKPAVTESAEAGSAEADTADRTEKKTDAAVMPSESVRAVEAQAETKADDVKADEVKADDVKTGAVIVDTAKPAEKADDQIKPVTDTAEVPAVKKDQARPADIEKAVVAKPEPAAAPKRSGQIAVFVSRKDSKLYVRQNFAPLFEVSVTIAPSDRPLGTHVFTAGVDKKDANILHWSVVTLPSASRYAERRDEDERILRKRKMTGAVEMKPAPVPDSPAEALDRLSIPADAMARITEALTTGASIIVSDQGINAGETGEGTDFIVSLH